MRTINMTPDHLAQVKALLDLCFGESAWSTDALRSQLEKTDSRCSVAIEDGVVIGFLAFEQIADEGSIVEIAVHPDHRRRGIARELIEEAIRHAADLNTVFLEVRESNTPAIGLYESLGFERLGVRKGYYQNPKEDALIMKKPSPQGEGFPVFPKGRSI